MRSICKQVQADVVGAILACDFFDDITVTPEDRGDLENTIQSALAPIAVKGGKTGIVVIAEEPEADAPTALQSPYLTLIRQKMTILENRIVNRTSSLGTNKSAYLVGETILEILFQSDFAGTTQGPVWPGNPAIRSIGVIPERPELVGVEVMLELHASLPQVSKVATPTISQGVSNITLACVTGSAVILYSIDDSFPSLTYSAPFANPAVGVNVRAIAKLSGSAASSIASYTVTA